MSDTGDAGIKVPTISDLADWATMIEKAYKFDGNVSSLETGCLLDGKYQCLAALDEGNLAGSQCSSSTLSDWQRE